MVRKPAVNNEAEAGSKWLASTHRQQERYTALSALNPPSVNYSRTVSVAEIATSRDLHAREKRDPLDHIRPLLSLQDRSDHLDRT